MQQTATAASLQMTKHLSLVCCINLVVWLESLRPIKSAETSVIHQVMLLSFCYVVERCASAIGHALV